MTQILTLPLVVFETEVAWNSDLFDPICSFALNGAPLDLTGITFRAMARRTVLDNRVILDAQSAGWASSDVALPNGWLVVDAAVGTLSWNVPQAIIGALPAEPLVGDVLARAEGVDELVACFTFGVLPAATRWPGMA